MQQDKKVKKEEKPSLKTYSKYDFLPGNKVIFFEDFSQDKIGDFPVLWNTDGSGEIVNIDGIEGKWLKMKENSMYILDKGFKFPENFTMEFDVIPEGTNDDANNCTFDLTLFELDNEIFPKMYVPGKSGIVFNLSTQSNQHTYSTYNSNGYDKNGNYSKEKGLLTLNKISHINIWVQNDRVRLYIHGEKIFDIPKALPFGALLGQLRFWVTDGNEPLISNIRIAESDTDLRSKLLTEGKLISYGIYFDSGKDIVKPESYPSIKIIADVLKENPNVKIEIVGHTDSDGDSQKNLILSQKRAESVRNILIKEFSLNGDRITTNGKGDSQAISDNNTSEGKAKNRRVEFIKK